MRFDVTGAAAVATLLVDGCAIVVVVVVGGVDVEVEGPLAQPVHAARERNERSDRVRMGARA
jgi:hypothetical protein